VEGVWPDCPALGLAVWVLRPADPADPEAGVTVAGVVLRGWLLGAAGLVAGARAGVLS
jgi:hypothetical protein